jgi:hypothetical protein
LTPDETQAAIVEFQDVRIEENLINPEKTNYEAQLAKRVAYNPPRIDDATASDWYFVFSGEEAEAKHQGYRR